ncbi:MAG TPA: GntR family transcriptional regulator [Solirubrobacteraceae bacterium]|nr:GntR family transcriptional regulator [Solirubrobacteraceae bacterium]
MSDGQPAYLAIADRLRERIRAGDLAPHTPLPSERALSETAGVSRMTARQAIRQLEHEGVVYRRVPRGTFVAAPRIALRIGSFSDEMIRAGRRPAAEVIWAQAQAPPDAARDALGLAPGETVHALQRLRRADGEPIALETSYWPGALCPDMLDDPPTGSIWALLRERVGVVPSRAQATFEVVTIDDAAAGLLEVARGALAIRLTRWTFDGAGACFEYARDLYRADRAAFAVEATIPPAAAG